MKISFLVTYYNQEQYVKQSLESILAIDMPAEWEILVGDDGSSDGTVDIVKKYIEKYPGHIRLYCMEREKEKKYDPVQRASANRINLLEKSTGDLFCSLDGDDYFIDNSFIRDAFCVFEEKIDVSVVAFGFGYFQNNEKTREVLLPVETNMIIDTEKYLRYWYIPSGACVHRKAWGNERIELLKKLQSFDDNDITINSLNFGKMFFIKKIIYAYRQTENSVYTSMDQMEKYMLNAYAYDVGKCMMEEKYHIALMRRYSSALINIYFYRKKIYSTLGCDICDHYKDICSILPDSLCYHILSDDLSRGKKREIRKIEAQNPLLVARLYAKLIKDIYCKHLSLFCEFI